MISVLAYLWLETVTHFQDQILIKLSQPADAKRLTTLTFGAPPVTWTRDPGMADGAQLTALHPMV
jgi:hypothetical protein